jgi:cyclase
MFGSMRGNNMLCKRIITSLLLSGDRLVKGTQFDSFVDVGDPVSQSMIASDQGADEICLLDITASDVQDVIDYKLVERITDVRQIPLSVGGGIKTVEHASALIDAGAERIVVNSAAICDKSLIPALSHKFGDQSVVVSIDVRRGSEWNYDVYMGKKDVHDLWAYLSVIAEEGVGEFLITDIEREGTLSGFNYDLYKECCERVKQPVIASGGAGCYDHIVKLFEYTNCDACALGKMLCLRHYDMIGIKSYISGKGIDVRHTQ